VLVSTVVRTIATTIHIMTGLAGFAIGTCWLDIALLKGDESGIRRSRDEFS
jgi:hypothetical protein